MGAFSIWHIAIAVGAAVLLFGGGGKISSLMGDAAHGIRAFREGLKDEGPASRPERGKPAAS
jgi:sec-independent protein translocase protein TatA